MQVKQPKISILYNSRDVTRDVSGFIVDFVYSAAVSEKADTIEVVFEDSAGLWVNNWYPVKGDRLNIEIGYVDIMVSVGTFTVDEINISGPPDQITIRAIAAGFAKDIRTQTSVAHEKKTLSQIVNTIASKAGLSVLGDIPNIFIKRATQYRETDLNFLRRLASQYGCLFSIRDSKLIFTVAADVEALESGVSIDKTDLISYNFTDKTSETYTRVNVKYYNPKSNKTIEASEDADAETVPSVPSELWQDPAALAMYTAADAMEVRCRVENEGQAKEVARSFLRANLKTLTGSISVEGNPEIMEGSNINITGMGAMSGRFHVESCEHRINVSGYVTTLEIKRTGAIDKALWASKSIIYRNFSSSK